MPIFTTIVGQIVSHRFKLYMRFIILVLIEILVLSSLAFGIKNYHQQRQSKKGSNKSLQRWPKSSNLYQKSKTSLQAFKKVFMISLTGGKVRHQQLKQMVTVEDDNQATAYQKKLDRNINLSIGLMGLALIGTWFVSKLLPIAAAGAFYLFYPLCQKFSQELKKGRITTELIEIISIISFLIMGYIFLATLITFLSLLNLKQLARTEEHSHQQLINKHFWLTTTISLGDTRRHGG